MSIIIYYCDQCASTLDFTGQTSVICQVCGSNNINAEAEKAAIDAKALAEQYLGDIDELERRLKASGDAQARDYIFKKDFQPRMNVIFDNLTEKYDEYFRRPIFHIKPLKKYNHLFNVNKVFELETQKGFHKTFTHGLNQFAMGQLELPVMNLLAASEESQRHIKILRHHTMFLSRLYNIRGIALDLNKESIQAAENLITLIINDCEILENEYAKVKNNMLNSIKFQIWGKRFKLNLQILKVLQEGLKNKNSQVLENFDDIEKDFEDTIQFYKDKNKEDEEKFPLFITMYTIEGLNIDKKIGFFMRKAVDIIIKGNFQMDFNLFLEQLESYFDIVDSSFNQVELSSSEWDPNWITTLEDPFERLFQLLDNFALNLSIIKEEEPIYVLEVDNSLIQAFENSSDQIIEAKNLLGTEIKIKGTFQVKKSIPLYIPVAAMNTYAILKKGKGGDEFESFLMLNPYFKFDPQIDNYGYPKSFGYLDIAESLNERDQIRVQLDTLENIIETGSKKAINDKFVVPILVTPKEIEEFVQKTYDLFEIVKEGELPIPDFDIFYKNVGFEKRIERLSGELIDYIYIPGVLIHVREGHYKKDRFISIDDFQWKLILPFNNKPKNPWNQFLKMEINPNNIADIYNEIQKFN